MGRLLELEVVILDKCPLWQTSITDNQLVVVGDLDVIDTDGQKWESFRIKIIIEEDYPKTIPTVFELSEKLSKDMSTHFFERDESCCLGFITGIRLTLKDDSSIISFIELIVRPFFIQQTYRLKGDESVYLKEIGHQYGGPFDYYMDYFNVSEPSQVIEILMKTLGVGSYKFSPNEECFCKRGVKYKKCFGHKNKIITLMRYVGEKNLRIDLAWCIHREERRLKNVG
jgi:hypothetical protein